MRIRIGLYVGALAFLSLTLISASTNAYESANQLRRIQLADQAFAEKLSSEPSATVRAIVFFVADLRLDDVRMMVSQWPVFIKGFRHGTKITSGGYSLQKGESLDRAVESYRSDHVMFAKHRIESETRLLQFARDEAHRQAIEQSIQSARSLAVDAEQRGPRIIGVEIEGQVEEIDRIKNSQALISVVELSEPGVPQPAIFPR